MTLPRQGTPDFQEDGPCRDEAELFLPKLASEADCLLMMLVGGC
jgi:hypothetical protein